MKYPFEKLILVCIGDRCNDPALGKERGETIREELKELNKSRGRKKTIRVCSVSCLDLCEFGPNLVAQPGGTVYSHLDRRKARRAYEGEVGDAPPATDLELTEGEAETRNQKANQKPETRN